MTAKRSKDQAKRTLQADLRPGESQEACIARIVLRPTMNAALTAMDYRVHSFSNAETDLPALVDELAKQCEAVNKGDLSRAESMLIAQAHSLDAIFTNLARRAHLRMSDSLEVVDKALRLALRAQSQCRATLETLSAIKNPPVVIARQANVTSGPQQVNNGLAREIQRKPNELLEQSNGRWLDGGAASQAIGGDKAMATVGAIDRAEVESRKKQ